VSLLIYPQAYCCLSAWLIIMQAMIAGEKITAVHDCEILLHAYDRDINQYRPLNTFSNMSHERYFMCP
jgi:hypothetical protein